MRDMHVHGHVHTCTQARHEEHVHVCACACVCMCAQARHEEYVHVCACMCMCTCMCMCAQARHEELAGLGDILQRFRAAADIKQSTFDTLEAEYERAPLRSYNPPAAPTHRQLRPIGSSDPGRAA